MFKQISKSTIKLSEAQEKEFLHGYHQESIPTFMMALALGSLLCCVVNGLYLLTAHGHSVTDSRNSLRSLIAILLLLPIVINLVNKRFLQNYIFQTKLAVLITLSILLTVFAYANGGATLTENQVHRSIVTVIISAWLCFTLVRVNRKFVLLALLPYWVMYLITYAKVIHDESYYWAGWMVLITAIIGWLANKRIEDRERLVFIQRKELETRLDQIKELLNKTEKTNAGIRHDVRQPVWAMGLYLGALQEDVGKPQKETEIKEYVMRLFQCLQSIDQTVARIATNKSTITVETPITKTSDTVISRSAQNKLQQETKSDSDEDDADQRETEQDTDESSSLAEVDLGNVLGKLNAIFSVVAKAQGVNLKINALQTPKVISNEAILQDTLANLISNAIKFAAPVSRQPWVVVHCFVSRNEVRFTVADNGVGIAPELQHQIFQPYYQIEQNQSDKTDHPTSEGLGLSMVERNIAQLPDHRLALYSNPNRGSCFKLYIPRA